LLDATAAGGAVFDAPPKNAGFPRITIGEGQIIDDPADCIDGSEVFMDVHVWSRAVGFSECKQIAGEARALLHRVELALDGHNLIALDVQGLLYLRDPDGLTSHGKLTVRALTESQD
jgi:hypothetical protein